MRLLCLPHAAGSPSVFRPFKDALPPAFELYAAQLAGREGRVREEPSGDLGAVVEGLCAGLQALPPLPVVMFGHSLGGLLAFEMMRALRAQGRPLPARLIVAAARAPHLPYRHQPLHRMDDAELLASVQRYGGTPAAVANDPELMRFFLPLIRADFRLLERYQFQGGPELPVPIDALAGSDDRMVLPEEVAGWRALTSGPFSMAELGGGHFFLHESRAMVIAEIVRRCAAELGRGERDG